MAPVRLKTVSRTQGNNEALKEGHIEPVGFRFDFVEVPVLVQAFRRMVRENEFDVCEMAFTTYLCAKAYGKRLTALPIFLVRGFHHGAIVCDPAGGIMKPSQLDGRRVGVNRGYTVTTGVWARGILADEYGVDLDRITWVLTGDEHVAEYRPPANVVPAPPGKTLEAMLAAGDIAAAIGIASSPPATVPLIADADHVAVEALRQHGLYPINHLVVVKDDLLEAHPGLAVAVFDAFAAAKLRYVDRLRAGAIAEPTPTDVMYRRIMETIDDDPLPYGIAPNRGMIDKLIDYAVRQRIIETAPAVEDVFHESTHSLIA